MSKKPVRIFSSLAVASLVLTLILTGFANPSLLLPVKSFIQPLLGKDSVPGKDSIDLKYPIKNNANTPLTGKKSNSLDLQNPPIYNTEFELDSSMKNYKIYNTVNGMRVGEEQTISLADYLKQSNSMQDRNYFKDKTRAQNFTKDLKNLAPKLSIKTPKIIDKIVGGGIDIKPNGSAELIFSYDVNTVSNPAWSVDQQTHGQFKFDQKIQLNVKGSIGNKINLGIGYSTETNFDFDNEIKLRYDGEEDDIVKLIEAGNVSLPIQGSLITGSQSLFGIKTKLQFGRLMVTGVFSQQKSEKKEITLENGAQKNNFSISSLEYDANRHFFLGQYFRNNVFEQAFNKLPILSSPVQITRIEVWVVNRTGGNTDVRDMVAFMDLGETNPYNSSSQNPNKGDYVVGKSGLYPSNDANSLYGKLIANKVYRSSATVSNALDALSASPSNFYNGQDYIKVNNARKLQQSEYTVNQTLGFISLNQRIDPGYALAVAYEYTVNGVRYQVGEFAQDIPPNPNNANVLFLKLLKSTATRTDLPLWDLMMKNIYALNSSQIQQNDFKLDVIYEDDKSGGNLNYIPETTEPKLSGQFLIRILGLDRLNGQQEENPDGVFDFLDGRTIFTGSGLIMFPYLEPFGSTLRNAFSNKQTAAKYVFQALYDSTQTQAEQQKQFDKFYLRGHYMGAAGSEISLNAINIPEGSVQVTAGGIPLVENRDYTVDYTLGRVKIINEGILNSGTPIKVTAESNSLFSIQQKTLMGARLDYKISNDFNLGGTFLYLSEKPLTQKVNIGDEPINNIIWGIDGNYKTDAPFLTKLVDKIPFIETKEKSVISLNGEFAQLIPGHPSVIGKNGVSYIDDFEGSEMPYDLRTGSYWVQASTPQGQPGIFKWGSERSNKVNFNRGLLSWYMIDDLFYRDNSYTPSNISKEMLSHHWMREVIEKEVFPNKQMPQGIPQTLRTFDLAYYPSDRGCYNYDFNLTDSGTLKNPTENWGGIMRKIETNDFEAANIEYIEFWVMDPYFWMANPPKGGKMYINLGEISEDILRDGELFFENGLSATSNKKSLWGNVPAGTPINYAFDNEPATRMYQDVGFDGLSDAKELTFPLDSAFLANLPPTMSSAARAKITTDPSADDYKFYNDPTFTSQGADILMRYKYYRNSENNSPVSDGSQTLSAGSLSPDVEDINNDFTLNETEAYYQYTIAIEPNMQVGQNYIVDKQIATVNLKNGKNNVKVPWYQFKIPIQNYTERVGQIRDFKSIRFMRLMLSGFDQEVVLRFARLQLVRGDWRRYLYSFDKTGEVIPNDPVDTTAFDISTVNIEANGKRDPIPYVLPPGIEREVDYTTTQLLEQNEQSLSFNVCGLVDGNSKAAYKSTFFDVRTYKRLKMYVHAEGANLKYGDMSIFVRLGTDYSRNYYEYELPLHPTDYGQTDPNLIWDTRNAIDIAFDEFFRVKQLRENNKASSVEPYWAQDQLGKGKVTVLGNPDLSNVKVIMVGMRNPSRDDNIWAASDDGQPVCGTVWINELRVTDFDESGGWAAIGRVSANLADFGNIAVTGNKKTVGYGGLEQKLQERSKEDSRGFGVQSYFELGKFFKEESGIKIPVYYDYSQQKATPEYNPLSPDIKLQTRLDIAKSQAERDSILYATETFLERQSLNFSNVQKMRKGSKKARFYDVENFVLTYAYSNTYKRDITTTFDIMKTYKFILNYNYNFKEYFFTPFGKIIKSKYLKLVSDFNIGLIPQSFAFKADIDRRYSQVLYRNTEDVQSILVPIYTKSFTMRRVYDLKWNFTKSLRFSYNCNVDAIIREPEGKVTSATNDTMWSNFMKMGDTKNFNQKVSLTYDLPLRKIRFTDWITAQATYNGSYNWEEAPRTFKGDSLGNTIQNAQSILLNTQFNLVNLYSKLTYLKTINQGKSNVARIKKERLKKLKEEERKKGNKEWNKLTEDDVKVNEGLINLGDYTLRLLMSLRSININYSINNGTVLPGFQPGPQALGNDWNRNAPGVPFILGWQDDIRSTAALNGWLSTDTTLNSLYMTNHSENLVAQATLEPLKGLRINIDMDRRLSSSHQEVFRMSSKGDGSFESLSPIENGSFSMSFFSIMTAFSSKWDEKKTSTYIQFESNRWAVAKRLNKNNQIEPTSTGSDSVRFPMGYSRTSQQVIIPAFIAAYTGTNSNSVNTDLFPKWPGINWRISYTGLSNIEFLKDWVKNISINHAYNSTYNINSFSSSLEYDPNQVEQAGKDIIPEYRVQQISFTEQLSPLIGVDISWANNWTTNIEYRTNRTIAFSFSNFQTSEIRGKDWTIGIGYRAKEVKLPFKIGHKKAFLEHELTVRVDISIKDNISTIIKLDEDVLEQSTQNVGGSQVIAIKPTIDYELSKNLKLKIFFTRNVNTPVISTSYPTKFTNIGFSLTYTLGQ
jgi:cell surface protein SprA